MSLNDIRKYGAVIGIESKRPKYIQIVDCIKQNVPAMQASQITEIGIHVTFPNDGISHYMQMAVTPIRASQTLQMDYVLLLDKDSSSMNQWIKDHDRELVAPLGGGLGLTKRKNNP